MPRAEKVQAVENIKDDFRGAGAILLTEYRGLKVKDLQGLRRDLAQAGARYRVLKNTLVRFAVRDLEYGELEEFLEGPTAVAFCEGDPVAPAKVLSDFAKANPNLVMKGGLLQGRVLDAGRARALADLESREVLLAKIVGLAQMPMVRVLGVTSSLLSRTARLVAAYVAQREEGGESLPPPAAEAAPPEPEIAPPEPEAEIPEPAATEPETAEPAAAETDTAPVEAVDEPSAPSDEISVPESTDPEPAAETPSGVSGAMASEASRAPDSEQALLPGTETHVSETTSPEEG